MAKYGQLGSTLSIDLEDGGTPIIVDSSKLSPEVQQAALMFGLRTVLRNSTAGKMDEPEKARKAMEARAALFAAGKWADEATSRASVELSDDERNEAIRNVIVMAKRAKGDTRDPAAIITAFNALPDAQRSGVVASLQKVIDKQMKQKLREKKTMAKQSENVSLGQF